MVFETIINFLSSNLSLEEAIAASKSLTIFIIGMVVYSIFVFKFYKFIAKRDIFKLNLAAYSKSKWENLEDFLAFLLYVLEHLIIFPLFSFFWFLILSILLVFLSELSVASILTSAMAVVATIRISSYYKEELAVDIAKTLPLAILGIFLIDGLSTFNFNKAVEAIVVIPQIWKTILYYLIYIVSMEIFLRILLFTYNLIRYKDK